MPAPAAEVGKRERILDQPLRLHGGQHGVPLGKRLRNLQAELVEPVRAQLRAEEHHQVVVAADEREDVVGAAVGLGRLQPRGILGVQRAQVGRMVGDHVIEADDHAVRDRLLRTAGILGGPPGVDHVGQIVGRDHQVERLPFLPLRRVDEGHVDAGAAHHLLVQRRFREVRYRDRCVVPQPLPDGELTRALGGALFGPGSEHQARGAQCHRHGEHFLHDNLPQVSNGSFSAARRQPVNGTVSTFIAAC